MPLLLLFKNVSNGFYNWHFKLPDFDQRFFDRALYLCMNVQLWFFMAQIMPT